MPPRLSCRGNRSEPRGWRSRKATTNDRPEHHLHGFVDVKSDCRFGFAAVRFGGQNPLPRGLRHCRLIFLTWAVFTTCHRPIPSQKPVITGPPPVLPSL